MVHTDGRPTIAWSDGEDTGDVTQHDPTEFTGEVEHPSEKTLYPSGGSITCVSCSVLPTAGRVNPAPDLAALKRDEVARRTAKAVEKSDQQQLAGLIREAFSAHKFNIGASQSRDIARYLLGFAPSSGPHETAQTRPGSPETFTAR